MSNEITAIISPTIWDLIALDKLIPLASKTKLICDTILADFSYFLKNDGQSKIEKNRESLLATFNSFSINNQNNTEILINFNKLNTVIDNYLITIKASKILARYAIDELNLDDAMLELANAYKEEEPILTAVMCLGWADSLLNRTLSNSLQVVIVHLINKGIPEDEELDDIMKKVKSWKDSLLVQPHQTEGLNLVCAYFDKLNVTLTQLKAFILFLFDCAEKDLLENSQQNSAHIKGTQPSEPSSFEIIKKKTEPSEPSSFEIIKKKTEPSEPSSFEIIKKKTEQVVKEERADSKENRHRMIGILVAILTEQHTTVDKINQKSIVTQMQTFAKKYMKGFSNGLSDSTISEVLKLASERLIQDGFKPTLI